MSERKRARLAAREAKALAKETARAQAAVAKSQAKAARKAARAARRPAALRRMGDWLRWSRRQAAGRWWTVLTVLTTATLFSVAWPTLHLTHHVHPALQPVVAAFAALPFLLVRHNPVLGWSLSAASALVIPIGFRGTIGHGLGESLPWQVVHIIVLLALFAAVCVQSPARRVAEVGLGTVLLFAIFAPGGDRIGWVVGLCGILAFALLLRKLWLSRRELARQEAVSELERTRRTALEERARIARDLHDVVAHHMSLIVVQSQTAPYRVQGLAPEARAEFDSIAVTAREALNEVRVMLGVLRSDDQSAEHQPQPGMAQLRELVAGSARAGVPVRMEVHGETDRLGMATAVVLYRIVQESLANATRHAPNSQVYVLIDVGAERVVATVGNEAPPGGHAGAAGLDSAGAGGGSGIVGMRERAGAVGGTLTAEGADGGGFLVTAELPLAVGIG